MTRSRKPLLVLGVACLLASCGKSASPPASQSGGTAGAGATTTSGAGTAPSSAGAATGGSATTPGNSAGGGGAGTGGSDSAGAAGSAQAGGGAAGSAGAGQEVDHSLPGVIVVLGSSTSAGTGPSDPNNAWVPRYKAYLAQQFPNFTLTNLAVGGQTTYHIQPTGYVQPGGRPAPVAGKNITAALALNPDAMVVNMPSNDQASDFSQAEQQANYNRVAELATTAQVLLWVSTSQPRNFAEAARLTSLMQTRDFIQQRFAPRTLDFWTPFAQPDGTIKPDYNSGDGTHMNDAAHAILAEIVIAAKIPNTVLGAAK